MNDLAEQRSLARRRKAPASDNLRRRDPIANFGKMVAEYRRRWPK